MTGEREGKDLGDAMTGDLIVAKTFNPHVIGFLELNGYGVMSPEQKRGLGINEYRFTLSPGVELSSFFAPHLKFRVGFSYDIFGRNALYGVSPLLTIQMSRRLGRRSY